MKSSRRVAAIPASDSASRRLLKFLPAVAGLLFPFFVHFEGLSVLGHYTLGIFIAAACLWVLEPIPIFATSIAAIFLQILLISKEGPAHQIFGVPSDIDYKGILAVVMSPTVVLFLGGFAIADAFKKYNIDVQIARVMLRPFGRKPSMILLGIISLTALFSAFMSNTACTAMMMAIMLPAVAAVGQGDRFRVAVILAVPYAANIGGMITPIGTPPNAVAVGALAKQGLSVDFFQWVLMAAPFALVMLAFMWLLFMKMFPPATKTVDIVLPQGTKSNWQTWTVYGIFGATVALWLTGPLHNLPDAIPALLPVAAFTALGILSSKDFNTMSWDILWLIAGGLTLGDSMEKTGLSKWVIGQVNWSGMAPWLLIGAFALGAMLLSEFMSHTAASNIFVPLGVAFATGIVPEAFGIADKSWFIVSLVVAIGLATSLAMALPISTPPNAIAYGTGQIKNKDMLATGLIIGAVGITLLAFGMPALWDFWKGIGLIR